MPTMEPTGIWYPDRDSAYPAADWWLKLAETVNTPLAAALGATEHATVATTGPGQVINFEDIPQTHHHLLVVGQCVADTDTTTMETLRVTFGDLDNTLYSEAQYRATSGWMDGDSANPETESALQSGPIGQVNSSTLRGGIAVLIPNYSLSMAHRGAVSFWYANAGTATGSQAVGTNGVTAMSFGSAVGRVRFHVLGDANLDGNSRLTMLLIGAKR